MRKLARAAISFSAAIFAANYILPQSLLLKLIVVLAVISAVLVSLGGRKPRSFAVVLLFFSVGLACFAPFPSSFFTIIAKRHAPFSRASTPLAA